jgi:hypothetical protein
MRLSCGDQGFDVQVQDGRDGTEVRVSGRSFRLDVDPVGPGVFVVREGGRARTLHLVNAAT